MLTVEHRLVRVGDHRAPHVRGRQELKGCSVYQAAETGQVTGNSVAPELAWTELFGDYQAEFCPRDAFHLPPVEADVPGFRVAAVSQQRTARGAAFPCHVGGRDRAGLAVFLAGLGNNELSVQMFSYQERGCCA